MDLCFQNPGATSGYLLERLRELGPDAQSGGAIFAFATADGIRTFLRDDKFHGLLTGGTFDLVVGVDAVTDERAIRELSSVADDYSGLTARVFVHDETVLFHPKLAWFRIEETVTVVIGSGNLTVRGLRENWEAFSVIRLEGEAGSTIEKQLSDWLEQQTDLLLPPDHPSVATQAAKNTGRERDLKHPRRRPGSDTVPSDAEVLVAEAPLSGGRPSQVNFHKQHYEGFFGAKAGTDRVVVLRSVSSSGNVGLEEVRPSSRRNSRNFSLELSAFDAPLPEGKRPIGVYLRLAGGMILYQRLAPGDTGYSELDSFLGAKWTGREDMTRQVPASLAEVKKQWPGSSLWSAEVPSS
jgi:hypothetical protein